MNFIKLNSWLFYCLLCFLSLFEISYQQKNANLYIQTANFYNGPDNMGVGKNIIKLL